MSFFKYPKIIPELDYSGSNQTKINRASFKYFLLSTFFYSRVEKKGRIYLKLKSKKLHYMPLFTMTKALAHYNDEDLKKFEFVASLLIKDMSKDKNMWGWKHENLLQLPGYPKKYSSYSALNNGRGLGVLIRYYSLKPSKDLLLKIKGVLNSFEVLSSNGGVLSSSGEFLEYSWGDKSPVVWNGFMSALVGLHDCYLFGPDEVKAKAKEIFEKGLKRLVLRQEELFYSGAFLNWIRYDDNKLYFADGSYMKIETRQLEYLSKIEPKLKKSLQKMRKINKENKTKKNMYEYYYFIKKRMMR
ncbi:MAG: D-glucuronyl C5-epimerase family protein [Candidatus Woesearchaeota archaeon]